MNCESIVVNSEYENIGVDDFAFHKGITYGTIVCDLDTHKPIDLLEDRTKNTLSDWFKNHIDIKIVTGDRSNAYSKTMMIRCHQRYKFQISFICSKI
ncbi:transposase [Clostridium estertheticum]|uniref:transposase n=1 Tax=Clostridium estertheticum TaxID=238834 RepID=UPI001CF26EC9|nr:transposase [Clostridium estertheticum]MCB2356707.1 transposase [Clostridium estertheticum]WAG42766.1 transposase [Clostridium estertheticum]